METQGNEMAKAAEYEAARLIRLLARLVKLSQKSMSMLGADLGLDSSRVSQIFEGEIPPQISFVLTIAAAIELTPEEFFSLAYRPRKRVVHPLAVELLESP
jgi:transcriptional regulator with XRE-family HTH domain